MSFLSPVEWGVVQLLVCFFRFVVPFVWLIRSVAGEVPHWCCFPVSNTEHASLPMHRSHPKCTTQKKEQAADAVCPLEENLWSAPGDVIT